MWIAKIESGLITLHLEPGTCLALADACAAALREATTEDQRQAGQLFLALRCAFEGLALVGDAHGRMAPTMNGDFTAETVRREWGGSSQDGGSA